VSSKSRNSEARNLDNAEEAEHKQQGSSGRVKFDDRGNAVWDWQLSTASLSLETPIARLRKLENPSLSLAEDAPTPFDKVKSNPLGTKKGYNPYDSGKLGKTAAAPKKKDLRRLSDWFKLKKQQSQFKKNSGE
jgi:hypothetical protein